MQSRPSVRQRHSTGSLVGAVLAVLGAIAFTIGIGASPAAADVPTQNVPLGNDDAPVQSDCPDGENDYWHFIIAPNNDTYSFVTINLELDGDDFSFSGADIIPNGTQTDNVFVQVPAGYSLSDITTTNSDADITPATGSPKFVLSHLCDGETTTTTTTTSTTTSTTSTTTSTTSTTTSTTSTTTTLPCEWDPQLPPDHPDCVPCEWNPELPPGHPDCQPPDTTTTTTTTTSTTSTTSTTTTTTLPCEWDPQLPAGSDECVPALEISSICFDIDNSGDIERYWHELVNAESVPVDVTWSDGADTIPANGSIIVSSADSIITLQVDGSDAATTDAASTEFCQNDVTVEKLVDGPGDPERTYTIQISRLVGADFVPEGDSFELAAGEKITVPLPSTFNEPGVNYKIEEIDAGGANATSVTPDSFVMNGHKGETISVVVQNDFAAISLDKQVNTASVEPGDELNYTLVATNTGALDLDPIVVFDRLPAEVTYVTATVEGGAGGCELIESDQPQLVRCSVDGVYAPGASTPPITILVQVDADLDTEVSIINQAQAIGVYDDGAVGDTPGTTDPSCEPTEGQVCDLSAEIGVTLVIPPEDDDVEQAPPTTTGTGSDSPDQPLPELPRTGADATNSMAALGAMLMLVGGTMVLATRRRETSLG